jgi:M6 family metalloprotease-like protein
MIPKNLTPGKLALASLMLLLLAIVNAVSAAPLRNYPTTIIQPDGQVIKCFVTGDEYYHWLHDENDYTIIRNETDNWYYFAVEENDSLVPSEYKVGKVNPLKTNLEPGARISPEKILQQRNLMNGGKKSTQAVAAKNNGTLNSIVIFVRFADDTEFEDSISVYEKLLNDSTAGSTSMYAYFKEVSYNRMFVKSHIYPYTSNGIVVSYQDSKPRSYYQKKTSQNPDGYTDLNFWSKVSELTYRATSYYQNEVSSDLNLDYNSDGKIDNITYIIKGDIDPEWGSILWGGFYNYNEGVNPPFPNININNKNLKGCLLVMQNDIKLFPSVLQHEMFHRLGAPDLYHYSADKFFPVGIWDLMEFNANPTQSMSAYMKYKYGGWIDSIPAITKSGVYYMAHLQNK